MKKSSLLTEKEFLRICDLINQLQDCLKIDLWIESIDKNFNGLVNSKKEAKDIIYKFLGLEIIGIYFEPINK